MTGQGARAESDRREATKAQDPGATEAGGTVSPLVSLEGAWSHPQPDSGLTISTLRTNKALLSSAIKSVTFVPTGN